MREIKYRQPIYCYGKFHHFHYWGCLLGEGRFENPIEWENGCGPGLKDTDLAQFPDRSQQYTGLKDMLGKEIWEGDIVKTQYSCFGGVDSFTGVVMYFEESTQFRLSNHNVSTIFDMRHNVNYVQGNIYENPELVKP